MVEELEVPFFNFWQNVNGRPCCSLLSSHFFWPLFFSFSQRYNYLILVFYEVDFNM